MVTELAARRAIFDRVITNWDTTLAAFTFEGEGYVPTTSGSWVRVTVLHDRSDQSSLGGVGARKFERGGLITFQVFTPVEDGLEPFDQITAHIRANFEAARFDGIRSQDAVATEIGEEGAYHQGNVDVDFDYQHTR